MSDDKHYTDSIFAGGDPQWSQEPILIAAVIPEPPPSPPSPPPVPRRRVWLPLGLFVATCLSTLYVGGMQFGAAGALQYAACLMTILVCHEAGHFFQSWRYGVYCSFPFFIPMPFSPIGTFGAVIAMDSRVGDRKELFDIGISGPLAGLVPTLLFCILGMWNTTVAFGRDQYGDPLLFHMLSWIFFPDRPSGTAILLNPMLFAGWVGLLITSLNLMPIGQLDGGHILYGLLRRRARSVGTFLLLAAVVTVAYLGYVQWFLMLFLLTLMGPHPPTANDNVPLGPWRIVLGWLMLAFIFLGFTPQPFSF